MHFSGHGLLCTVNHFLLVLCTKMLDWLQQLFHDSVGQPVKADFQSAISHEGRRGALC